MLSSLPIDGFLDSICDAVARNPITIVEAPPGTGKTTRVAPALMARQLAGSDLVYLVQPRRLAAKSVATRIAWERGCRVGDEIGYQVRFDSQVTSRTQLIVATEGVLLRKLHEDVTISDTKILLLDEFHERSLNSDLLLGMLRRVQSAIRDDLKLVIMSATIESELLQSQLGGCPVIRVPSPQYPVSIHYRPPKLRERTVDLMVATLTEIVPRHDGDVLAFLPGAGEINRCQEALNRSSLARDCNIVPLYGSMSLADQSRAIETGPKRKIVLATNVAETSLTIEGVRVVVDSGLARVLRYSPDVGLDKLTLESISQASATQRTGRAGRVAPGVCYRLWAEVADRSRASFLEPEIRRTDIVSATLQLYAWGEGESDDFPWLEPPRAESLERSRSLLRQLGAIEDGKITEVGMLMSGMPTHPRLARMIIAGFERGCLARVCLLASLLSERDPFDSPGGHDARQSGTMQSRMTRRWDSDCLERLAAIEDFLDGRSQESVFGTLNRNAVRTIVASADQLREQTAESLKRSNVKKIEAISDEDQAVMQSILFGFSDRLAKRRNAGRPNGLMVGGKGVCLAPQSGVTEADLFLCVDIETGPGDAVVRQASRVELDWLPSSQLVEKDELFFHPSQKQVVARRRMLWNDLVLSENPTSIRDEDQCAELLWQAAIKNWDQAFPQDGERVGGLIERVNCLRTWIPELELPELGQALFQEVARDLCRSRRSLNELRDAPWLDWIQTRFTNEQWQAIEREAPAKIQVPSGSWIKIQYELGKPPIVAVKIQEVFSWRTTPRIAMGRVAILLHLLSPNMRPQQITDDLSSFWANGYPIVKKELKRRYPKHSWPDDPTTALPGRR